MVVRAGKRVASAWALLAFAGPVFAQQAGGAAWEDYEIEARIWLDRGAEPVLENGERVRVYYRVTEDANVAIFHIDTDGTVRLVFPRSPRENHMVLAERDYRVLFPETSYWFVDEDPGMGYFFIVASPDPMDLSTFAYSYHDGGWDLSRVGRQVYSDPYEAIDDYVAALIPEWENAAYALDFSSYHVGDTHEYPRFLCYDCHGFTPYNAWNPYYYACTSFRVVVYDDPIYYPSYRYGGEAIVYPAAVGTLPRYVFKERADGEPGYPLLGSRGEPALGEEVARRVGQGSVTEVRNDLQEERENAIRAGSAGGETRALPVVVPWPGGPRTNTGTQSPTSARTPQGGRGVPSAGTLRGTRGDQPTPTRPSTSRPSEGGRTRPVLEPRSPERRPANATERSFWDRFFPSGIFRPSDRGGATPNTRSAPSRPNSAGPQRTPTGGSARPAPQRRPGGTGVRPSTTRPRGGASARPPRRRPGGGGDPSLQPGGPSGGPTGPTR